MINRVAHKEAAKRTLKENGNQSGMIGMEILYGVIKNMTVSAVMAAVAACVAVVYLLLFGLTVGSLLLDLRRLMYYFLYNGFRLGAGSIFGLIVVLLFTTLIVPLWQIIKSAVSAAFDVSRARYYLHLRKTGVRTKATTLFESFDFFMQFALVLAAREFQILWMPVAISFASGVLTSIIRLIAQDTGSMALILLASLISFVGSVAAWIIRIYRRYQFWPLIWVLADHPQLNAKQAFDRCIQMTHGHIWDLIVFDLSYLGWKILNVFTGNLLNLLYVTPYYNTTVSYVYEELKGRPIVLDGIKANMDGNGMTIGVNPRELINIKDVIPEKGVNDGSTVKPALRGVTGMYAGSEFPLTPNQPVVLGRDGASAQIVFSTGAQKISRRHCEIMFDTRTQQYRVTDFSTNGTYVNGSRLPVNMPQMLARGTSIALGDNNNILSLV